ncbi:microtubule organization protein AKNA isoform X3 [Electrophorus electricus]|uniref:microtubule organization protein AKNA isoform X3 n=1 Tax=Electrophorus electricus TaxID=8005 RepID=UPI0015CF8589|nr:microtubule organization protein AKNA isoform X3 [Electrophorus electricus]
MERLRSSTRAGVPVWTPAPGYTSPPSPVSSQRSWLELQDADFHSHMDENGIIGFREGLGEMGEEEAFGVEEEDLLWDAGTPEPEDSPPRALDVTSSEPPSRSTRDGSSTHNEGDGSFALGNWSGDEEGQNFEEEDIESLKIYRPQPGFNPERAGLPAITSDEGKVHREQSIPLPGQMNPQYDWKQSQDDDSRGTTVKSHKADRKASETGSPSQNGFGDMHVLNEKRSVSSPLSSTGTPHASVVSHLPQLSSEVQASNCEAEPFPEQFIDCTPEPQRFSHALRPYQPVRHAEEEPEVDATPLSTTSSHGSKIQPGRSSKGREASAELERPSPAPHQSHQQPSVPCPQSVRSTSWQARQQRATGRSSSTDSSPLSTPHHIQQQSYRSPERSHLTDVRKGQLSHPLPDFSKVEPRVRFPKNGYKAPMSGKPPRKRDSKPEAPLVFKSPADIVREVLLSSTEGLSSTPAPEDSHRHLNFTLPEEFRCPLKASALVQQLQEDYNRLLTKYAEAENTIDRLRLEAKVSLHSDPPKHSALSGVFHKGSKVMTLSFPQAQRALLSTSTVHPNQQTFSSGSIRGTATHPPVDSVSSRQSESLSASQLAQALTKQTQMLQLQIDEFEEFLKNGRLEPYERMEGLNTLARGLDSVERAYLGSRDHGLQRQKLTGGRSSPFDSDRELEGLIFHLGMRLEELRECVEQTEQNRPTSEPGPSPPPHAHQRSGSVKETEPQPEGPVSAAHADVMAWVEVSSVSGESDGLREEGEEEAHPSVFPSLHHKHQWVEKDFSNLMDRQLSKVLNRGITEETRDTLEFRNSPLRTARNDGIEDELQWKTNDQQDSSKPAELLLSSDSTSGLSHSAQVVNSMETLPASVLPGQQASGSRSAGSRKSCSTLGGSATMEKRTCKGSRRTLGAPPQEGVRSPETDSGFVGSDSSRVTPATYSLIQKRAAVRVTKPSVTKKHRRKAEAVSLGGQPDPIHTRASSGRSAHRASPAGGAPDSAEVGGEAGRWSAPSPSPCPAPRCWPGHAPQPWPSSGIREVEQQGGSAPSLSGEEAQQGDQYTEPTNQDACYLRNSSPTLPYRYGDPLTPQSSAQLTNQQEALQSLQVEVDRLRECLEGTLRMAVPAKFVKVPPSTLEGFRDPASRHTSTPQQRSFRSVERQPSNSGRRREAEVDRSSVPRRRSVSVPRLRPRLEINSEHARSEPKPWTSKYIPASPAAERGTRANIDPGTVPCMRSQHRGTSADGSEESGDVDYEYDDDEESRGPAPLCRRCMARRTRASARPVSKVGLLSHARSCSNRCPLCGAHEPKRTRLPLPADESSNQREAWPLSSTRKEKRGVFLAAAPPPPVLGSVPVLHCVPVCPSVLYPAIPVALSSHPKPLYLPQSEDRGHRSRVRGHHRRSLSTGMWLAPSTPQNRTTAASGSTRKVPWHTTHSLTSGLRPPSPPVRSCVG